MAATDSAMVAWAMLCGRGRLRLSPASATAMVVRISVCNCENRKHYEDVLQCQFHINIIFALNQNKDVTDFLSYHIS